jgi:hypothetical protein
VTLLATEDPSTVENGDATPASLAGQRNHFLLKNRRVQGPRGDLWGDKASVRDASGIALILLEIKPKSIVE